MKETYRLYQLLVLIAAFGSSTAVAGFGGARDERATTIVLSGIPPPYSFKGNCTLPSGDWWIVGGNEVIYRSASGERREQSITAADLLGVSFVDSMTGWVVGTEGEILGTTDGGTHWIRQKSGVREDLEAINCVNRTDCWVAGRNGVLLRTVDGGKSWRRLDAGTSDDLYALDFLNAESGLVVGENGIVLRTRDGGRTWGSRRVELILFPDGPFAAPANLEAVSLVTDETAWVGSAAGIAGTTDGGKTWTRRLKEKRIIGLVFKGPKKGWAVGKEGVNFSTTDSGEHWQRFWPRK